MFNCITDIFLIDDQNYDDKMKIDNSDYVFVEDPSSSVNSSDISTVAAKKNGNLNC